MIFVLIITFPLYNVQQQMTIQRSIN